MRKVIFVLFVTQITEVGLSAGLGPVYWNRIDADRAAHSPTYSGQGTACIVIEREIRGEMPTLSTPVPALERERSSLPTADEQ